MGSRYAQAYNYAARVVGFKVANHLAAATRGLEADSLQVRQLNEVASGLPRIVFAPQLWRYEYLYGELPGWQPTLIHPNELMDGALFSSFCMVASLRRTTYLYQNHPVVDALYNAHDREAEFLGVMGYQAGKDTLIEAERITGYCAKLIQMAKADGVVLSWVGAGRTGVDIMMLCEKLERKGIRTTLLYPEMSSRPQDPGLIYSVPQADAIVSTGSYEQVINLPVVDRVIGGKALIDDGRDAQGPLALSLTRVLAAATPFGASDLVGVDF